VNRECPRATLTQTNEFLPNYRRYKIARLQKQCLAVSNGEHGTNPLTFMHLTLTIPLGEVRTIVVHSLLMCLSRKRPAGDASEKPRAYPRMLKGKLAVGGVLCLALGLVSGGVLFSQSQPRSVLAIHHCQQCLNVHELAGLLASVGIQKFPGLLPSVVFETDRTLAMQVPSTKPGVHYVIIPKKDIKNIGDISAEDAPYLLDIFAVVQHLIKDKALSSYRVITNGPGFQDVTYLHFHLLAK